MQMMGFLSLYFYLIIRFISTIARASSPFRFFMNYFLIGSKPTFWIQILSINLRWRWLGGYFAFEYISCLFFRNFHLLYLRIGCNYLTKFVLLFFFFKYFKYWWRLPKYFYRIFAIKTFLFVFVNVTCELILYLRVACNKAALLSYRLFMLVDWVILIISLI